MSKLTPTDIKHEKFANLISQGMDQSKAYREVYDCSRMKDKTVWEKASKLANTNKVKARILELQQELKKQNTITREWIIEKHKEVIDWYLELKELSQKKDMTKEEKSRVYMLKDLIKGSDYRGSLDSVTKMLGLNEPDRSEVTIKAWKADWE